MPTNLSAIGDKYASQISQAFQDWRDAYEVGEGTGTIRIEPFDPSPYIRACYAEAGAAGAEAILAGSHTVQRGESEVVLGVGGPAAPYAKRQHEDASLHHEIGEDHFLEKAAADEISALPGILQKRVKAVL